MADREKVFEVLDTHMPMEGSDYCTCGAHWSPAHLVGALFGDPDEFGLDRSVPPALREDSAYREMLVEYFTRVIILPTPDPNGVIRVSAESMADAALDAISG